MTAARVDLHVVDLDDLDDDGAPIPDPIDWEPDAYVVAEVVASPKSFLQMTKLPHPDRAWLVAGLTVRGMTAEEIAARTHCSLRLIRTIRSWPMTAVCEFVHRQTLALERELSGERSAHSLTRRELAEVRKSEQRKGVQLDQVVASMVKKKPVPVCLNNHPQVEENVYRHTDRSGTAREFCRECNRDRASRYRRTKRAKQQNHTNRVTLVHSPAVASAP